MYADMNYSRLAMFRGPFEIAVLPFLHTNRLSLVGAHHEPSPIMFQLGGSEDLHLISKGSQLKTWSMATGKLRTVH